MHILKISTRAAGERSRRAACGLALGAALLGAMPTTALACTQVWVPGQFTATGDRYVGRSEDYASRHVKIFGVEEPHANTRYTSDESDFDWTSDKTSYRYTYVRDHPSDWNDRTDAYSEAGINEHGVSCSATLTTNYNNDIKAVDPSTSTGIGEYTYASVVLGESRTAREGVELLGRLIDEQGTSGRDQITISDPVETWLFCALSGHQWVAYVMPQDQASVNPNMGNLRFRADLDNPAVCLHSKGLLSVPQKAGLLKTFEDGTPDIASTYGVSDAGHAGGTATRYVQGLHYFGADLAQVRYAVTPGRGVTALKEPTQFFTPGRTDFSTFEILRSLATRGEGTDVDANANAGFDAIGNNRTVESHMFQIRDDLGADIATVQWEALSRTEFSVYVPLYSALITKASPYFSELSCDATHQGPDQSDNVEWAMQEEPDASLPFVLMDINTLAYNHRASMAGGTRAYLDALQKQVISQQDVVDACMQAAPESARSDIANKAQMAVVEQVYKKCDALLDQMRAYVRAGNFEQPFAPTGLTADGTDLAEPVLYADAVVPPVVSAQPASVTCSLGAPASDLSVTAAAASGTGALTYEWFEKTASGVASTGVTTPAMPVDTAHVGERTFFCRVTNACGLSVDSAAASVTVAAPAEGGTAGSHPGVGHTGAGHTGAPAGHALRPNSAGELAQTSDPLSASALSAAVFAGVISVVAGTFFRRPSRS